MTANRFEEQVVRVKRVWEVRVARVPSSDCAAAALQRTRVRGVRSRDVVCAGLADIRTFLSSQAGDFVQVSSHPSLLFRFILRFCLLIRPLRSEFCLSGPDGASRFSHRRAVVRVLQLEAVPHPLPPRPSKKMRSSKG
jgi:hypothetical protein